MKPTNQIVILILIQTLKHTPKPKHRYDKKVEDLERTLDAPLHVLYLKQLGLLREKAMKSFKAGLTAEGSEYEAMMQADEFFRREAETSTRQSPEWDYAADTSSLKGALSEIASRAQKVRF